MITTLDKLKRNQKGVIKDFFLNDFAKRRFLEMGFLKNEELTVIKQSYFSSPVILEISGYVIMIRKKDAKKILVTVGGGV